MLPGLEPQVQTNDKLGTLVLLGVHRNGATHSVKDPLGDGHTQASALNAGARGTAIPLEGFIDVLGQLGKQFVADQQFPILPSLLLPADANPQQQEDHRCQDDGSHQIVQDVAVQIDVLRKLDSILCANRSGEPPR